MTIPIRRSPTSATRLKGTPTRFQARDPLGFYAGDQNVFRYVVNGPTLDTDPTGLISFSGAVPGKRSKIDVVAADGTTKPLFFQVFTVKTDNGNPIEVWKFEGAKYNCHGLTFGGADDDVIVNDHGPFSIIRPEVFQKIIEDDGWKEIPSDRAEKGDIVVWYDQNDVPQHSGRLKDDVKKDKNGKTDLDNSKLNQKPGPLERENDKTVRETTDWYNDKLKKDRQDDKIKLKPPKVFRKQRKQAGENSDLVI